MLFVSHWKVSQTLPLEKRLAAAQKVMEKGLFPPKGVKVNTWLTTPDDWGILVLEADKAEDVVRAIDVWRAATPDFFTEVKTSPAVSIQDVMKLAGELIQKLK